MSESVSFLTKSTKTFVPCKCQFNISNAGKGLELCSFIPLNYSLEKTVAPQVKITIPRETKRKCNTVRRFLQHPVIVLFNPLVKQRHYFANKACLVKAMVFPVVVYGCESWTMKKCEHRRIDAFELWCGRRLLRVSWTARRSNQSILKEISPEYSLEGLMLKLKLQHFGHLM